MLALPIWDANSSTSSPPTVEEVSREVMVGPSNLAVGAGPPRILKHLLLLLLPPDRERVSCCEEKRKSGEKRRSRGVREARKFEKRESEKFEKFEKAREARNSKSERSEEIQEKERSKEKRRRRVTHECKNSLVLAVLLVIQGLPLLRILLEGINDLISLLQLLLLICK